MQIHESEYIFEIIQWIWISIEKKSQEIHEYHKSTIY